MKNKKQLLFALGLTVILFLMIISASYLMFSISKLGKEKKTVKSGIMLMNYTGLNNTFSINKTFPTMDKDGKNSKDYFDFTVESNTLQKTNINYEITVKDITSSNRKIDSKYIKLYLTKLDDFENETNVMAPKIYETASSQNEITGRPADVMSLITGTISSNEKVKYRLRMYVNKNYNKSKFSSFTVKINVYGKVKKVASNSKLKEYTIDEDFHTDYYRQKITSIITKKDNEVPITALEKWDLSEKQDSSIIAYIEDDGTGKSTYKLTIGGKDGIIANQSMEDYFNGFSKVTSIDLSAFDTSKVTSMNDMFSNCSSLTSLDLSSFDTSKVTDMYDMFSNCNSLASLNVSSFCTSQVIFMGSMFNNCQRLINLDLSGFDISRVIDMNNMFSNCSSLTSLDLSSFDTSEAISMNGMFSNCSSLTSLDLSSFDTSNVTDMSNIFSNCNSLINLDLSDFDTSNVTDMSNIFSNCSSLINLDVSNFHTTKVVDMSYMFSSCIKLSNINLSSFNTSKVKTMHGMFFNCKSLKSLNLSNFDTSKVIDMNYMFLKCGNLDNLDFRKATFNKETKYIAIFSKVPSNITIITKNEKTKNWLKDKIKSDNITIA